MFSQCTAIHWAEPTFQRQKPMLMAPLNSKNDVPGNILQFSHFQEPGEEKQEPGHQDDGRPV